MVHKRLFGLLGLAVGLVLAACDVPHPPCDLNAIVYPEVGRPLYGQTQLGTEYATAYAPYFLAPALAITRASLAKINDVRWGDIAPNAGRGPGATEDVSAPCVKMRSNPRRVMTTWKTLACLPRSGAQLCPDAPHSALGGSAGGAL